MIPKATHDDFFAPVGSPAPRRFPTRIEIDMESPRGAYG